MLCIKAKETKFEMMEVFFPRKVQSKSEAQILS